MFKQKKNWYTGRARGTGWELNGTNLGFDSHQEVLYNIPNWGGTRVFDIKPIVPDYVIAAQRQLEKLAKDTLQELERPRLWAETAPEAQK